MARGRPLHLRGDSQLVVNQMTGVYKTHDRALQNLGNQARAHIASLGAALVSVSFVFAPREDNAESGALATRGRESRGGRRRTPPTCGPRPLAATTNLPVGGASDRVCRGRRRHRRGGRRGGVTIAA